MDKELKELKSVLRSIVVSSHAQVDVRSLQRDYKNMMGSPIPIAKYGYRDVVLFLKERCNDCFLFQGVPSNPVLTLIVPDSLKHIDQFVRSQKASAVTKIKGKRRSVNETAPMRPNMICQTYNAHNINTHSIKQNIQRIQPTVKPPDIKKDQIRTTDIPTNGTYNSNNDLSDITKSTPYIKLDNGCVNATSEIVQNGYHENVRNFFKKRQPMYDSSQYLDTEECIEQDKVSSKGDDSGRQTSSSQSSTKKGQFEELKCEIHELIKEYEDGILPTDLMRLYRERYDRELNFNRFGHHNINSLLCAMDDRVAFSARGGGVRLQDAAAALAALAAAPTAAPAARPAPRPAPRAPPPRALPVDADDALPGIDFDPDVFPRDCIPFLESIPAQRLGALRAGSMLECTVGEVYSPSHFWLQRLGDGYSVAMDEVMDEMSAYYTSGAGRTRVLARGAVRAGHYCSSLYERDWHRSLIVKVLDADTVKVRHVDYGTVDTVKASELKPLLRQWAALPAQALRARLAGLRPGAGGRRWPHAAAAHFLNMVRDRRLVANVVAVDPEEDTIETFLIDTTGADDVCLTAEMIRAGHADARGDSALRTAACYLNPRFGPLESGDTPNFAEIHRYLADGISLEYVESYRRHVPTALPSPPPPPPPQRGRSPPPAPAAARALAAVKSFHAAKSLPAATSSSPAISPSAAISSSTEMPLPAVTTLSAVTTLLATTSLSPAISPSAATSSSAEASLPAATSLSAVILPSAATSSSAEASLPAATTLPAATSLSAVMSPSAATSSSAEASLPAVTPLSAATSLPAASSLPTAISPSSEISLPAVTSLSAATSCSATASLPAATMSAAAALPPRPACYAAYAPREVRLSGQECELYALLSSLDPAAAHCYMLSALRRAGAPDPRSFALNPRAPPFHNQFRPAGPPPSPYMHPSPPSYMHPSPPSYMHPSPPSYMRPPPGF